MATQVNVSRSSPLLGSYHPAPVRTVFTSHLSAATSPAPVAPQARASEAWGTVRILVQTDDALEYLATIYNPRGETFTTAYLRRGGAGEGGVIVATLFSDVALRTPYIQVRGTISIARESRGEDLAEELRETPQAFAVSVHASSGGKVGTIRGSIE